MPSFFPIELVGIILGIASTGVALGPLIGGALTQRASWRWCMLSEGPDHFLRCDFNSHLGFYLNLPLGVITIITLALIRIPEAKVKLEVKPSLKEQIDRLDLPGCILFVGLILMLLLAINWGGVSYPWNSATIIGLFCGAAATLCLFVVWEHRKGDHAMLPLDLFHSPVVSCAAAAGVMSYGGLYVIIIYLPLWFQAIKGVSPLESGIYYLPSVITTTIAIIISGFLGLCSQHLYNIRRELQRLTLIVSKLGYYTPFMIVGGVLAAVAGGLMTILTPSSPNAAWICYQLVNGIARGMMSQQPVTAVQANVSKNQLSIGMALVVFSQNFGAAVFISLGQTTFENSLLPALEKFVPDVDAKTVASVGATNFRSVVPRSSLSGVVLAYNKAVTTTFVSPAGLVEEGGSDFVQYLSVGSSCAVFALAWGLGWKNLKQHSERSDDRVAR